MRPLLPPGLILDTLDSFGFLAIAMVHGRELRESDERLLEALVVVGLAGGAVKLRESVLVAGGQRITVAAFRRLPEAWLGRAGTHALSRVLGKALAQTANALGIAGTTAKTHLYNIFSKTGVSRQADLMRLATRLVPSTAPMA